MEARLSAAEHLLDRIDRKVEGIERITMVREPATGIAADAYDGLRRKVGAALAERAAHLHQLAQFDAARRAEATPEELESLVREWMGESRLEIVLDPDVAGAFTEVGDPKGDHLRVTVPAYVDALTGRVVRGGFVERTQRPPARPDASPGIGPEAEVGVEIGYDAATPTGTNADEDAATQVGTVDGASGTDTEGTPA